MFFSNIEYLMGYTNIKEYGFVNNMTMDLLFYSKKILE